VPFGAKQKNTKAEEEWSRGVGLCSKGLVIGAYSSPFSWWRIPLAHYFVFNYFVISLNDYFNLCIIYLANYGAN